MAIAESTHWYDRAGSPAYTVIAANGSPRATTLRDARKFGYVPSVTTIISVAAKPALENWKINQALMAALTLPRVEGESLDDFMARAKDDSKEQARQAAERGEQIHANIEAGFSSGIETEAYAAVRAELDGMFPGENWIAESSFCSREHGYGGKIDLYSESGIFVDFKTKDNLDSSKPEKLVYDEHGMQLSAYAEGMGFNSPERVSIFVDRSTLAVAAYRWERETHSRHFQMFCSLLSFWKLSKNYSPEFPDD